MKSRLVLTHLGPPLLKLITEYHDEDMEELLRSLQSGVALNNLWRENNIMQEHKSYLGDVLVAHVYKYYPTVRTSFDVEPEVELALGEGVKKWPVSKDAPKGNWTEGWSKDCFYPEDDHREEMLQSLRTYLP